MKRAGRPRGGASGPVARFVLGLAAIAWVVASVGPASAKTRAVVRVTTEEFPHFGRVILDAPGLSYAVRHDGGHVVIWFPDDPLVSELPPTPRNVLAIRAAPGGVELTVPPGADVNLSRTGARIVVEIDDTVPDRTPPMPLPDVGEATTGGGLAASSTITGAVPAPPRPDNVAEAPPARAVAGRRGIFRSDSAAAAVLRPVSPAPAAPPPLPVAAVSVPAVLRPVSPAAAIPHQPPVAEAPGAAVARPVLSPPASPPQPPVAEAPAAAGSRPVSSAPAIPPQPPVAEALPVQRKPPEPVVAQSPPAQLPMQPADPPALPITQRGQPTAQPAAPSEAVQVWPVTRDAGPAGPVAILAIKTRPPAGLDGAAIRIPFTGAVGAALFSRGPDTFVVFDERRPIDLSALRDDPVFGSAVVTLHPASTVIRLTRLPGRSAMLLPAQLGWILAIAGASPKPAALVQDAANNVMTFAADAAGQVVAIADPRTGATLLVGTQRVSGQAMLVERQTPEFILPVTGQGIVVEPLSDAISLRITQAGFVLSGAPSGLVLSPAPPMAEATMAAARLTRTFEFPRQTTANLAGRARRQAVAAAMAPATTRGPKRHALAESTLGLGLGAETQTLLRVTMKDDPREAASATTTGLAAIAALLAGRPEEAGDLADPRITETDEIALWRGVRTAMLDEGSPAAAAVFATTAPLLFTYPPEMRRRLLPLVLETMALGGEALAAAPLLAEREHDPSLAYARALLKQAQGDNDAALVLFDAVDNTRSALDHARAAVRATELRLSMGLLDSKAAADALEKHLFAWRGDARDLALRLRIAELRQQGGAWRSVFALLRGAKADFPGHAAEIDRRLKDAFAAVPRDPSLDKMEPTELIALLEENARLMEEGPDGEPMRALLADKLMALDLPKRADPLLTKLMRAAPFGPARAGFGATLATLRLREGDGDGAILALSESNSADMGDAVRERRGVIIARTEAKRGATSDAMATLAGDKSHEAEEARAAILEQAGDWPAARDALAVLMARVVPDTCAAPCGPLDGAQLGVTLRLATAAMHAGDDATLGSLRTRLGTRIGAGPQANMFRLLTAEPVRGTADLRRARAEMGLARAVAADIGGKPPPVKTP